MVLASSWYPDIGWATLRNSWRDDATFLAVKSGMTWNHAHADAGSFVLYHAGAPLIIDSGTCSYDNAAYSGYYAQSRAHNLILFNGKGEPGEDHLRGVKFPGQLPSSLNGLGVKYVYADATGPTSRYFVRNYRHWLWIGDTILIFDDVLAHEPGRFDWLLHYSGTVETGTNRVAIVNGDARADIHFLYPAGLTMREEEGLAEHQPNRKVKYLAISAESGFRDQKFVTAIVPHPVDRSSRMPEVELLALSEVSGKSEQEIRGAPSGQRGISARPDQIGVRIRHGDEITDVYLNVNADGRRMHVNTNNILGGWDTDAYLLAVTRPASSPDASPQNATRYFVACCSYLRKGRVVLSSLAKVDAAVRPGLTTDVVIRARETVDVEIIATAPAGSLTVNGASVPARFDAQRHLATFRVASPAY
jgi:hypothetical protein